MFYVSNVKLYERGSIWILCVRELSLMLWKKLFFKNISNDNSNYNAFDDMQPYFNTSKVIQKKLWHDTFM